MRLTHTQLKQIIKEEIQRTLNEETTIDSVVELFTRSDKKDDWLKTVDVQFKEWGEGKNLKSKPFQYKNWTPQDFKSARSLINSNLKKRFGYKEKN